MRKELMNLKEELRGIQEGLKGRGNGATILWSQKFFLSAKKSAFIFTTDLDLHASFTAM